MTPAYRTLSCGQDSKVADFVSWACGRETNWGAYNTLGFWDDRGLKVGLVYNSFSWPNIAIHIGARKGALWARPEILYHIFAYPFEQLRCTRVTAPVLAGNLRCLRAVEALGFELEGRLRGADRTGQDLLIWGMLAEECRWLTEPKGAFNGRRLWEERPAASA